MPCWRLAGLALRCSATPPERSGGSVPVLLVTIDTLRADHLGIYGGEVATPYLDRLAEEGAVFLDAQVHSPLTLPSHSSILTGTDPTYQGVRERYRKFHNPYERDCLHVSTWARHEAPFSVGDDSRRSWS